MNTAAEPIGIPNKLRKKYGQMVNYGDSFDWEWATDQLAEEAARYIEHLEAQLRVSKELRRR